MMLVVPQPWQKRRNSPFNLTTVPTQRNSSNIEAVWLQPPLLEWHGDACSSFGMKFLPRPLPTGYGLGYFQLIFTHPRSLRIVAM